MNRKMRVLIPDGESGHALIVARALAETKKVDLYVLARDPKVALRYSLRKKFFGVVEPTGHDFLNIPHLLRVIDEKKIDVILPIDDAAHKAVTKNIDAIHGKVKTSPLSPIDILEKASNKRQLAKLCSDQNIPYPISISVEGTHLPKNVLKSLNYPILIKPEDGHGGINIRIISTEEELKRFFESNPDLSLGNYLLQEYVEGYDIDMSLLARSGKILAFTMQQGFLKSTNVFAASAGIKFLYNKDIYDNIERLIGELNFSGIAHIDLRYDKMTDDFKIIEINPRFWGSLTGSVKAGVNFPYLACLAATGEEFRVPSYIHGRYVDLSMSFKKIFKNPKILMDNGIKVAETDINYMLSDPLAEYVNIMRRRSTRN